MNRDYEYEEDDINLTEGPLESLDDAESAASEPVQGDLFGCDGGDVDAELDTGVQESGGDSSASGSDDDDATTKESLVVAPQSKAEKEAAHQEWLAQCRANKVPNQ